MYNGTKEKQVKEKLSDMEAIILMVIIGAALIVVSWIFFIIHSEWIKLSLPACILYVVFSFFLIRKMKRLHDIKKIEDWLGCGIHPAKKHLKKYDPEMRFVYFIQQDPQKKHLIRVSVKAAVRKYSYTYVIIDPHKSMLLTYRSCRRLFRKAPN